MRRQSILRTLLFVIFFGIGAAALGVSILCVDLLRYYTNRQLLAAAEESLRRLESLNTDYDALLQQLQKDPNLVKRIGPAVLGTEPEDEETIYPKVTPQQLAAARRALTEGPNQPRFIGAPLVPGWISRCSEPPQRVILFLAGAFLVLISFIWFGSPREQMTDDSSSGRSLP